MSANRLQLESIYRTLARALDRDLIGDEDTAAIFFDLSFLESRIAELKRSFDNSALHTNAIKANPLVSIQKYLNDLGMGAEAASLPELHLALKAGFPAEKIIFDSPVKTSAELVYAIKAGVIINADSLDELKRIDQLIDKSKSQSKFGLRINPQVGAGRIKTTSVAGEFSKFGVPVKEYRQKIIDSYLRFPWLTGIHLHIGSQGIPLAMLVRGVKIAYELAGEINHELEKAGASNRITLFDIGGGLPAKYRDDDNTPSLGDYDDALRNEIPGLFGGVYGLITEFGRHLQANAGWAISRVESVKRQGEIKIALTHLGADMFVRKCYNPDDWHFDMSVVDRNGKPKTGIDTKYIIAGPLCFAGDIIARDLELPAVEPGDYIVIRDVGAYTFSMWSRYNSRQIPKIIGYENNGGNFRILKERESLDDICRFWQ